MTDYTELVKALRHCMTKEDGITICEPCPYYGKGIECENVLHMDAAAAIEALQAEIAELKRVNMEIFEDLPKRGEWKVVEDFDGDTHYQCSVCGEEWYFIDGTPADNNANYCPRCGAKMEELKPCQSQIANCDPPLIKAECVGVIRHPTDQNMLITVKAQKLSFDVDLAQKELCQAVKQIIDSVRFDEVQE